MTTLELSDFIATELRGLWPDWRPTDAETAVWANHLKGYSADDAKRLLRDYYAAGGSARKRPDLSQFVKVLHAKNARRDSTPVAGQRSSEPRLLCHLQSQSNPRDRRAVYLHPSQHAYGLEQLRTLAERTAQAWGDTYHDHFAILWPQDDEILSGAA